MAPEEKPCDNCKRSPADFFEILQDDGTYRDWCSECYFVLGVTKPLAFHPEFKPLVENGICAFCGAQAVGISVLGKTPAGRVIQLWCRRCGRDLKQWTKLPESRITTMPAPGEPVESVYWEREARKMDYMKRQVTARGRGA